MIDQEKDITVAVFGKGDISVGVKDYETTNYPYVVLKNCEPTKIGDKPESTDKDSPIIKLVFLNKESLDVVISKLQEARENFVERKRMNEQPAS